MKQNQHELGNKLVVVAGGAGEIGERITRVFLQKGARVLVPSRSKEKLKALGASLRDISTGELIRLETDVSTPQGLKTLTAAVRKEGVLRAAVSAVGSWWQGPSSLEVPVDEIHRVFQGTFFPHVGLTQALIPALGPDTHFIKLNGILSMQAIPNVSAFGVSATAQMAWTRFLIAEATESTPWITELVIDSLVRTRSRTLPKEYISADDIAHEILRIVTEENEHQIATTGKGPGDAEVEFVPLPIQASENNLKRLFGSFKATA
uniref:Short-chain dehydrogenase/reductase SDR n=1 Tax=Solibacter usitatus (strain Ellin6076) TaxID=234267 RepID=Q01TL2_SOLUE